jgi:hypothetical protein
VKAQNEDASGTALTLPPVAMANYTAAQWAVSQCGTTNYNLGSSTSTQPVNPISGLMNNDVWFQFTAVAEVAKIKVCNPATFDVSIELWNAAATGTALAAANIVGSGQKEVLCATSLTVGTTYKVRVGRANGTGGGTFNIIYEHLGLALTSQYSPDPPNLTCYNFNTQMQRPLTAFGVGSTHWKFIGSSGTVYGPYTTVGNPSVLNLSHQFRLELGTDICENEGTLQVLIEVQAADIDCQNIWWGYSTPMPIIICPTICPTINFNSPNGPCGGVQCNIYYLTFGLSNIGQGFQYQYRFTTDNGQTEFITNWSTSPFFSTSTPPFTNYFRFGKIYQVYVRVRRCASNPQWCGPCTYSTCGFPSANIASSNTTTGLSNYCVWRNRTGTLSEVQINAVAINGMDQYRFRLMPVDPCSSNPFTPTGAPITTNWSGNAFFLPSAFSIPLNQVYILQVQFRVLPATLTNPSGQTITIPGQQSDWGWPCFIGFRSSASPPVGSPISCCNFPLPSAAMLPNEYFDGEGKWTEFYEWEEEPEPIVQPGKLTLLTAEGNEIQLDVTESNLAGNGQAELFNLSGQLIHRENLTAIHENSVVNIVTKEELPTGIYIVSVSTPFGRVTEKFFIANY